jgi:tetratricopeptide (TPR) repeat protein
LKYVQRITILLLVVGLFGACSRKKSSFMSRNYHAVTAEFNAIYNGDVAFTEGKEELALTFRDNFWEILPVERIELKEELTLPGEASNPKFNRAEEKAAKAIQKHSIYINGKEYNPQIDEAYMLLGKARYYDERFVASQDAFNFILNRYPTSNSINEAKMWKAKTNIRLNNEEGALDELAKLLENDDLSEEDNADASAIMAQAFINLDSLDAALPYIKLASEYVKDNELKGRYSYIKGQLYNRLGHKDSANMAFQEVIDLNRKSPRVYMINAYIAQARNFDYEKEDKIAFLELLNELEENRENRPFLDIIFNQKGEYYRNTANIDTAVIYYNKSIKAFRDNRVLQSVNYSTLAEISFDNAEYKIAGQYYDSTLTFLEENTRPWRRVKKKRENLDDVIKYEDIAEENDSILRIVAMTEAQQIAFFTDYTSKLKAKAIEDSIASAKALETIENKEFYKKQNQGKTEKGGKFYFYNSTTVAFGKVEFKKIWGDRKLEDNWRVSSKRSTLTDIEVTEGKTEPIAESERYKPETYLSKIPKDPQVIDGLTGDRNFAYYQLGLIYKEKFREYSLATNRLEKLLSFEPEERLVLPAKYNLFKIYDLLEKEALAEKWRNDILTNHPDSRYAEILRNPNAQLATDESSPEFKYKALYREFENARYQYVIDTAEEYITLYTGNGIVPKLEMLKATALARQDGFEAYKKALNFVALNYPQADEGKQAQDIYATVLPKLAVKEFATATEKDSWKVVYKFDVTEKEAATDLLAKLNEAITAYNYNNMSASMDYYDPNTYFVIIHGLNTQMGGRGFAEVLREKKEYRVNHPYFEISSPNYKVIQIHKNLNDYLASTNKETENNNPQN